MPGLDSYLVTLGIKGQDVVLSTMDKIRKKSGDLTKKKNVISVAPGEKRAMVPAVPTVEPTKRTPKDVVEKEKDNNKFSKAVNKFSDSSNTLAHGMSRLDPAAMINSGFSAAGKIMGLGVAANAAEAVMNIGTNSINMAKSNAAEMYNLTKRNAAAQYYGGNISFGGAGSMSATEKSRVSALDKVIAANKKQNEKIETPKSTLEKVAVVFSKFTPTGSALATAKTIAAQPQNDKISAAERERFQIQSKYAQKWSNEEMASLRTAVGSSFGVVQKPLADALKQFTESTTKYDVNALTRVAAGNWQSTGTDKGWMIQQMADSFGNLPPSIAQRFQASLLERFGAEEIQKATPEQETAQTVNAAWNRQDEAQIGQIFDAITENAQGLLKLSKNLNDMQASIVSGGVAVASSLNYVADGIKSMKTYFGK